LDALQIINSLSKRSDAVLDPRSETFEGIYYDVNGDYRIGALDALNIINSLARSQTSTSQGFERDFAAIDRIHSRNYSEDGAKQLSDVGIVGVVDVVAVQFLGSEREAEGRLVYQLQLGMTSDRLLHFERCLEDFV